jgi:geranylgeranyl reductase family protein
VVGAGPAGAAAALHARQLRPDASVLLVDKAAFPRDKPCGDGIAPHGVDELRRLDATAAVAGYEPLRRLRLRSPRGAEAARDCTRPNWVIPRAVFDARLVELAVARGVELRQERVRSVDERGGEVVVNGHWRAPAVVGADGANSSVRRLLGLAENPPGDLAIAVRGYAPDPPGEREQFIAWTAGGRPAYVWSFSIGDGRANVGYGLLRRHFGGTRAELHERLGELLPGSLAEPGSLRTHHLPLSTRRPRPGHGRVLLAGDAASLINPLSGEGIYYALASGRLAAAAAFAPGPAPTGVRYERALRAELGRHLRHASIAARALRLPGVLEAGIAATGRSQAAFDTLVEIGLGQARITPGLLARLATAGARPRTV